MNTERDKVGLAPEQVEKLGHLARRISRTELEPQEIFQYVLEIATELVAADVGTIHLLNKEKSELRLAAIKGVPIQDVAHSFYKIDEGVSGQAAQQGKTIIINDVSLSPGYRPVFPAARSELVVPISIREDVIGVINLESSRPAHFTSNDAHLVTIVAEFLTLAFQTEELKNLQSGPAVRGHLHKSGKLAAVLMPFNDPFNKYYRMIFKPAIEEAGFTSLRADEVLGPSEIMRDIWDLICDAQVVLAELTGRNPNVMYEIGLSHGVGKPVVLVVQSLEDVPFDLRKLRCILYDTTDPEWAAHLHAAITESIKSIASDGSAGPYTKKP